MYEISRTAKISINKEMFFFPKNIIHIFKLLPTIVSVAN